MLVCAPAANYHHLSGVCSLVECGVLLRPLYAVCSLVGCGYCSDQYVYAGSSGAIGALSVLFGGCVSKVLVESIQGENQFVRATPILFVIGMVVCVLTQTHLLNRAMMVGDNMSVVPMYANPARILI